MFDYMTIECDYTNYSDTEKIIFLEKLYDLMCASGKDSIRRIDIYKEIEKIKMSVEKSNKNKILKK